MDPQQNSGAPQTAPQTAPQASPANSVPKTAIDNGFAEFKERSHFNTGLMLVWMVAAFSILATLFFWWMNKNEADALADKKSEKDSLMAQLSTPGSVEIEDKAQEFKASVTALKQAYADKYSYSDFLANLNKKLTSDIKLSSITVDSAGGVLNISGSTKSYRSVADLMVALKSWDSLKDVELLSVANNKADNKIETDFSISANIIKNKTTGGTASDSSTGTTTTTVTDSTSSTEGGSDAAQ